MSSEQVQMNLRKDDNGYVRHHWSEPWDSGSVNICPDCDMEVEVNIQRRFYWVRVPGTIGWLDYEKIPQCTKGEG
jgi:hypothetical protein